MPTDRFILVTSPGIFYRPIFTRAFCGRKKKMCILFVVPTNTACPLPFAPWRKALRRKRLLINTIPSFTRVWNRLAFRSIFFRALRMQCITKPRKPFSKPCTIKACLKNANRNSFTMNKKICSWPTATLWERVRIAATKMPTATNAKNAGIPWVRKNSLTHAVPSRNRPRLRKPPSIGICLCKITNRGCASGCWKAIRNGKTMCTANAKVGLTKACKPAPWRATATGACPYPLMVPTVKWCMCGSMRPSGTFRPRKNLRRIGKIIGAVRTVAWCIF